MMSRIRRRINFGFVFILPFMIGLIVFRLLPFLYTLCISFTNWNLMTGEKNFTGLANYQRLINDANFFISMRNTVKLWAMNIFPRLGIALLCAVLFAQSSVRCKGFFKIVFYFPNLVNSATVAVLAAMIMGWQSGVVNRFLMQCEIIEKPIYWLGQVSSAQGIVAFVIWWMWFGYSTIMFTTGILNVPISYIEAAIVDGANAWQRFWKITFPLIRPTVAYVFLTTLIGGLQNFEIPRVITDGLGAPDKSLLTMVMQMHTLAFKSMQYGYGSAFAMGIFVITAFFAAISYRFINKKEE